MKPMADLGKKPETVIVPDDGTIPNNRLPFLIYRAGDVVVIPAGGGHKSITASPRRST